MKSIRRNKDIIFNNTDLICIHKFKKFPVFMGCTSQNKNKDGSPKKPSQAKKWNKSG